MHLKTVQDILPLVEQPSRYLGCETNSIVKDPKSVKARVALAFPDLYEIGTSHFGIQILYDLLNKRADVLAERAYAPAQDMETFLREQNLPLASLETGTALAAFDLLGFSLLYELGYTNVLAMLDLAGIPMMARDRTLAHPLVIAGGPCTSNPEPVADFFDAMVIGDGETVLDQMVTALIRWRSEKNPKKETLLESWAAMTGVYVPRFYQWSERIDGKKAVVPRKGTRATVQRAVLPDMNDATFPESPIVPFGRPVHDRLRMEISRGCTRGCRFCQAGMIYRPVRERDVDRLVSMTEQSLETTGYEDLSLLSLSTGDYSHITELVQRLMTRCENNRVAISLPSLRAGTLTPELMQLIRRVRKTGFTLAPEAGSQRLRDVINKNISQQDIVGTVQDAFQLGWKLIKLYFMVGLPTETEADLEAIVALVQTLRQLKGPGGRRGQLNVSVGTFIPKPHTPFQWAAQIDLDTARSKIKWLKERLKMPGVSFKWQNPETSIIEGLWSRGDRKLAALLVEAFRLGCRFDGWSDRFRFDLWEKAMENSGIDLGHYTTRIREKDAPLPWDHIDTRVTKTFLADEWEKAKAAAPTADCRQSACNLCGVCDFEEISPKFAVSTGGCEARGQGSGKDENPEGYKTLQVWYRKKGPARFFGHLELINIFSRAIRRADICVKYTQGFHPKAKISFDDPLPLGMESEAECLYLTVEGYLKPGEVVSRLNPQLPRGLTVFDCRLAPPKNRRRLQQNVGYRVLCENDAFGKGALEAFRQSTEWIVERIRPKGKRRQIDIRKAVLSMERIAANRLEMVLACGPGKTVRPGEVLSQVFGLSEMQIRQCRIQKLGDTENAADPQTHGAGDDKRGRSCSSS